MQSVKRGDKDERKTEYFTSKRQRYSIYHSFVKKVQRKLSDALE